MKHAAFNNMKYLDMQLKGNHFIGEQCLIYYLTTRCLKKHGIKDVVQKLIVFSFSPNPKNYNLIKNKIYVMFKPLYWHSKSC
jgi:hypothetical protein